MGGRWEGSRREEDEEEGEVIRWRRVNSSQMRKRVNIDRRED